MRAIVEKGSDIDAERNGHNPMSAHSSAYRGAAAGEAQGSNLEWAHITAPLSRR
jgi:hypothetical protein